MLTLEMPARTFARFARWFEETIGAEYEADEYALGMYSVTCFEITRSEARKINEWVEAHI